MGWSCVGCTLLNEDDISKCAACATKRNQTKGNGTVVDWTKTTGAKRPGSTLLDFFGDKYDPKKRSKREESRNESESSKPVSIASSTTQNPQKQRHFTDGWSVCVSQEPYAVLQKKAKAALKEVFGYDKLRNQQPVAIECALKRQSQIVVMATGGGKSMCFWLPGIVLGGVTVVVSPLIALMKDQVESLIRKGIKAACISSDRTQKENDHTKSRLLGRSLDKKPANKYKALEPLEPLTLVYVTPEQLQTQSFQSILHEMVAKNRLAQFAIDEAHCMSTWGLNFRKAYRKLDCLRRLYPNVPCMALTATATPAVIEDIQKILQLEDAPCHVGSFDRKNIMYKVRFKEGLDSLQSNGAMLDLVKFITKQHKRARKANEPCSGIVYVHKRDDAEHLAAEITKRCNVIAMAYHGKLKREERSRVQEDWQSGKCQIATATVAFGMGIDLAHVRYVIHWAMAKTVDGFYQESGRAGRDGKPAISLLYFSKSEAEIFNYIIKKSGESSKNDNAETVTQTALNGLEHMVDYCTAKSCRRQFLLKHFGEENTDPQAVCQKTCDYCQNPKKVEKALASAIALRDVSFQRKQNSKRKGAAPWNGQWDRPHGEDYDCDQDEGDWNVGDLGITSASTSSAPFQCSPSKSFRTAASILSKFEKFEAREVDNENDTGMGGFVHFQQKPARKESGGVTIPEHIREQLKKASVPSNRDAAKNEPERKETSADLKTQLEAIKAQKAALEAKRRTKTVLAAPPPPPPVQVSIKPKRR